MNRELFEELVDMGLKPSESEVYLVLLEIGESKVGDIIKKTNISSSNVHEALDSLVNKGLVSFILKNKIKRYNASSLEGLSIYIRQEKELLEDKEKKLKILSSRLKKMEKVHKIKQNAEVFLGLRGIRIGFRELFKDSKKGQEYLFFYKYDETNIKLVHDFFSKMDLDEVYKKLDTKGIYSEEYKKFQEKRKYSRMEARFTNFPIPSSVNVFRDKVFIIAWMESPVGFMIQSAEVAEKFRDLFYDVWKQI